VSACLKLKHKQNKSDRVNQVTSTPADDDTDDEYVYMTKCAEKPFPLSTVKVDGCQLKF
jgi:hypothetical protein